MSIAEKSKISANLHSFLFSDLCVHYTHILKWACACILLTFNICLISHCKSLFSRFLMCNQGLTTARFRTQAFLHMPPWAAEHQHALCLASWGKGSSEMRRLSQAVPVCPWCTGMSCPRQFQHLLFLLRAAVTTARRVNRKKKVANQTVCTEGKRRGQRCLKTDVVWPWIRRIVSHICKVCMATLQNTALRKWMGIRMKMQRLSLPPVAIFS